MWDRSSRYRIIPAAAFLAVLALALLIALPNRALADGPATGPFSATTRPTAAIVTLVVELVRLTLGDGGRRLRGLTGQRIVRALKRAGWYSTERSGKHLSLEHDERPGIRVTIPIHGGKDIPVKTLMAIIKQAGLTVEEFEKLV